MGVLSIDYIRVNEIDEAVQIYGTVVVSEAKCVPHIVYHRASSKSERVVGKYMTLTGPSRRVCGDDTFCITVYLWVKYDDGDAIKEIANGMFDFNPSKRQSERSCEVDVLGEHGSISVGLSIIRDSLALIATVKVVILNLNLNDDDDDESQIYGTIKARRSILGGGRKRFDKSTDTWVEMNPQPSGSSTTILFDKSPTEWVHSILPPVPAFAITLSSHSDLTIEVDLWDRDHQIVLGSVPFTAVVGTQSKNITATGQYGGQVEVSITCK